MTTTNRASVNSRVQDRPTGTPALGPCSTTEVVWTDNIQAEAAV